MGTRMRSASRQASQDDGTVWTMRRGELGARCALTAWADEWELCVLIDGMRILTERRTRSEEIFELAEVWRQRLLAQAWQQVVPRAQGAPADRGSSPS